MKHSGAKITHFDKLCGVVLQSVNSIHYLGVLLSEDLYFSPYIANLCSKASRTLGFLRHNLRNCPTKLRETAYITMMRSVLDYADLIWDPYLVSDTMKIENIQCTGARFVVRDYRRDRSCSSRSSVVRWTSPWTLIT